MRRSRNLAFSSAVLRAALEYAAGFSDGIFGEMEARISVRALFNLGDHGERRAAFSTRGMEVLLHLGLQLVVELATQELKPERRVVVLHGDGPAGLQPRALAEAACVV